jgi:hypothetical protein
MSRPSSYLPDSGSAPRARISQPTVTVHRSLTLHRYRRTPQQAPIPLRFGVWILLDHLTVDAQRFVEMLVKPAVNFLGVCQNDDGHVGSRITKRAYPSGSSSRSVVISIGSFIVSSEKSDNDLKAHTRPSTDAASMDRGSDALTDCPTQMECLCPCWRQIRPRLVSSMHSSTTVSANPMTLGRRGHG